jgi:hypothetical protein
MIKDVNGLVPGAGIVPQGNKEMADPSATRVVQAGVAALQAGEASPAPRKISDWVALSTGIGTVGAIGLGVFSGLLPATVTMGALAIAAGTVANVTTRAAVTHGYRAASKLVGQKVEEKFNTYLRSYGRGVAKTLGKDVETIIFNTINNLDSRQKPRAAPQLELSENIEDIIKTLLDDQPLEECLLEIIRDQLPPYIPLCLRERIARQALPEIIPIVQQRVVEMQAAFDRRTQQVSAVTTGISRMGATAWNWLMPSQN